MLQTQIISAPVYPTGCSYYDPDLMDAICKYTIDSMHTLPQSSSASVLYCCAYLNYQGTFMTPLFTAWAEVC
jgi:hypothetical protein